MSGLPPPPESRTQPPAGLLPPLLEPRCPVVCLSSNPWPQAHPSTTATSYNSASSSAPPTQPSLAADADSLAVPGHSNVVLSFTTGVALASSPTIVGFFPDAGTPTWPARPYPRPSPPWSAWPAMTPLACHLPSPRATPRALCCMRPQCCPSTHPPLSIRSSPDANHPWNNSSTSQRAAPSTSSSWAAAARVASSA